jgi:hypothetical protein
MSLFVSKIAISTQKFKLQRLLTFHQNRIPQSTSCFLDKRVNINPLPLQFKALLHGKKDSVFSDGI